MLQRAKYTNMNVFAAVDRVVYNHNAPLLYSGHGRYFDAIPTRDYVINADPRRVNAEPLEIIKNVFNLTDVFGRPGGIIVSGRVRDAIANYANVVFRPVVIARAFYAHFVPGSLPEESSQFNALSIDEWVDEMLSANECSVPDVEYFDVICYGTGMLMRMYNDCSKRKVFHENGNPSSIYEREVVVSKEMIDENGVVHGGCMLWRHDLFERVRPFLPVPFFWFRKYSF